MAAGSEARCRGDELVRAGIWGESAILYGVLGPLWEKAL